MNFSSLSKLIGAGVIAASLAVLPVQAQDTTTGTTTDPSGEVDTVETEDDGFDWGWLGLLGLAGLAGLAGKKRPETTRTVYNDPIQNDPNVTTRPGSDYNR